MRKYSSALFVLLVTAGCAVKTEKAADTLAASDSIRGTTSIDTTTPPTLPPRAGGSPTTQPPLAPDTAKPNPSPGTSFTVTGANAPKDSVLASLSSELLLTRAVSIGAKFDTQLAGCSRTYAGTATVRYHW